MCLNVRLISCVILINVLSVIVSFVVVSFVIVAAFVVVWWSFDYVTVIFMLEFVGLLPYT